MTVFTFPPRRSPRLLLAAVIMILLVAAGWWGATSLTGRLDGSLTASGTLEADEVLIGPEVAGRIVEVVRAGDSVRAGTMVARLDDSLLQLQIRQAGDAGAQQQLLTQADRYQLRSPISGVVTRVPMHTGEVAAPGQTIAAVADLTTLKLTVYILEGDLGRVRVGQSVTVTADPFGTHGFEGVVTSINQRAEFTPRNVQTQRDRLNLVFGVEVRVANPGGALKPGMPADAAFLPLT